MIMQSFGTFLRTEREKKGIRLEEIASLTKIHLANLELMEKDRWEKLPAEPFIRGFITAYAKYVGLNPKETLALFQEHRNPRPVEIVEEKIDSATSTATPLAPWPDHPHSETQELNRTEIENILPSGKTTEKVREEVKATVEATPDLEPPAENPLPPIKTKGPLLVAGLVLGLVLVVGIVLFNRPSEPTPVLDEPSTVGAPAPVQGPSGVGSLVEQAVSPNADPSATLTLPTAPITTAVPATTDTPAPVAPNASPLSLAHSVARPETSPVPPTEKTDPPKSNKDYAHELVVIGNVRTWIKVVIDDAPPIEYFLGAGDKATYHATKKIKMVLGNSAGAQVFHNGEPKPGVKFSGTIRSYIFPPDSRFPQDTKRNTTVTDGNEASPSNSGAPGQDND